MRNFIFYICRDIRIQERARPELTFEFEYDPGDALMDDFRVTLGVRSELKVESGEGEQKNSKVKNLYIMLLPDHDIPTLILNG